MLWQSSAGKVSCAQQILLAIFISLLYDYWEGSTADAPILAVHVIVMQGCKGLF